MEANLEPYRVNLATRDELSDAVAYLALHYKVTERSTHRVLLVLPMSQWWSFLFYASLSFVSQSVIQEPAMKAPAAVKQIPQGTRLIELRVIST